MLWDLFVGMLLSFCGFGGLLIVVGLMCGLSDGVERRVERGAIKEPLQVLGTTINVCSSTDLSKFFHFIICVVNHDSKTLSQSLTKASQCSGSTDSPSSCHSNVGRFSRNRSKILEAASPQKSRRFRPSASPSPHWENQMASLAQCDAAAIVVELERGPRRNRVSPDIHFEGLNL